MAKENIKNLPDMPEELSMEGLEAPVEKKEKKETAAKPAAPAEQKKEPAAKGKSFDDEVKAFADTNKKYFLKDIITKFPEPVREDIKAKIGVDLSAVIRRFMDKNDIRDFGNLMKINSGDFTSPMVCKVNGTAQLVSIRLFNSKDDAGKKWDCEVCPVKRRPALDENGQPKLDDYGNIKSEIDVNPIAKGEIISFAGTELSAQQCDELRLTGFVHGPVKVFDENTMKSEDVVLGSNKYNNHYLCAIPTLTVENRIKGYIFAGTEDKKSRILLRPKGCFRYEDNSVVMTRIEAMAYVKDDNGKASYKPLKTADGNQFIELPVNAAASFTLEFPDGGKKKVNLSENQVAACSPKVVYKKDNAEVVAFLSPKDIAIAASAQEITVGAKGSMSFTRDAADKKSLIPVVDNAFAATVHFSPFDGKLTEGVSFSEALRKDLKEEEEQGRFEAMSRAKAESVSVGQHI